MHIWMVEAVWLICFAKANFFLQQRNIFYLTIMVVANIENGKSPSQSQLKVINNPTN